MEIDCHAPETHSVALYIEPWGDMLEIPAGKRLRLVFDGEMTESVVFEHRERGFWLGVPRYTVLHVFAESGELLGEYNTGRLPPVPPGLRPI